MKNESGKYTLRQVVVTRELVDTLLANNNGNRPISRPRVAQLVRDIKNGNWQPNGSPIVVDADGNLLDGQHRLEAIKEAGYPRYITLILVQLKVRGDDVEDVYVTMNSGRTGSAAQIFAHNGVKNGGIKTAICNMLIRLGKGLNQQVIPSRAELVKMYNLAPRLVDIAATMKDGPAIRFQAPALAAFTVAAMGIKNPHVVWDFARDVGLGANLKPGTAGHRLFVYCNSAGGKHVSTMLQCDLFLRTLKAVFQHIDDPDAPVQSLRVTRSAPLVERALADARKRGYGLAEIAKVKSAA